MTSAAENKRPTDANQCVVLTKETARLLYSIYIEGDDLVGAALGTRLAVKELRAALGIKSAEAA